jgi:hypothetical protein
MVAITSSRIKRGRFATSTRTRFTPLPWTGQVLVFAAALARLKKSFEGKPHDREEGEYESNADEY